jgi:hypothetical protein
MGTKFTFKDEKQGAMTVDVTSFSYSMNMNSGRAFLNIHGTVGRPQASCKFAFESTRRGHHLKFTDAFIWDGSDPRAIALQVKNLLLQFVKQHPDIPESFRQRFMDCVIQHPRGIAYAPSQITGPTGTSI